MFPRATVLQKSVFAPSPGAGRGCLAASYYTTRDGLDLLAYHTVISRSDTCDEAVVKRSADNGRTWGDPVLWPTRFDDPIHLVDRFGRIQLVQMAHRIMLVYIVESTIVKRQRTHIAFANIQVDLVTVTELLCMCQLAIRYIDPTGLITMLVKQDQRRNRATRTAIQDHLSLGCCFP